MMIARRRTLFGLGAALCAPAIIRTPGLLMPVKAAPDIWDTAGIARIIRAYRDDLPSAASRGVERTSSVLIGNTYTADFLHGTGAPSGSLGESGNFYIDLSSPGVDMYGPRTDTTWPLMPISLRGPR